MTILTLSEVKLGFIEDSPDESLHLHPIIETILLAKIYPRECLEKDW